MLKIEIVILLLLMFLVVSCDNGNSKINDDDVVDSVNLTDETTDEVEDEGELKDENETEDDLSDQVQDIDEATDEAADNELIDEVSDIENDDPFVDEDEVADEIADEIADEVNDESEDGEVPDDDALFTGIRIIEKGGFFQPDQLYTDGSTRLAVVEDNSNIRTRIFDLSGTPVCEIDEGARGVAFDDEGNIYITVFGNEVKKYSSTCQYISKAGGTGTGDGKFAGMFGIAFYNSKLYIVDQNNGRIQIFNKDLSFDSVLGIGALDKPSEIDINSSGQIAVYEDNFSSSKIKVFKTDLSEDWTTTEVTFMGGMALRDNGTVVITYSGKNCVKLFKNGSRVDTVGTCGEFDGVLEGEFDVAAGAASLDDGSVLVADKGNSRIKKFTEASADNLNLSDIIYGIDYLFTRSESLWIDSNDHLYFTDYGMIRVLDDVGNEVRKISSLGTGENQLNDPKMMTIDETSVYVADVNNNYLYSFKKDGTFQSKVLFYENSVFGMADDSSYVYVATGNGLLRYSKSDLNTNDTVTLQGLSGSIKKITSGKSGVIFVHDGSNICRFADADSAPNCISASVSPNVMVEDNDGNLLAVYNYSVVKYDSDLNQIGMLLGSEMGEYGFIEYVKGIAVDSKGYVYISESTTARSRIIVIDLHF